MSYERKERGVDWLPRMWWRVVTGGDGLAVMYYGGVPVTFRCYGGDGEDGGVAACRAGT